MAKGIIYLMDTCVDGLVKIGKTGVDNFQSRMANLERDGYRRIGVLKREFAIEVEDYDEKEKLIHEIFSKSRVGDSELFSIDINLVKQLMTSLEGRVVYPEDETKTDIFEQATEVVQSKNGIIPNGKYKLRIKNSISKEYASATMEILEGKITVKAGAVLAPLTTLSVKGWIAKRDTLNIKGNIVQEDFDCNSPSMAAAIVCGRNQDGWHAWKNAEGKPIDIYRQKAISGIDE
ncbi:MAG: DUF4357 domain-containing protein [Clostridia bacterium]|nr:DUF4357 domain-containing protein [Clostridia bacterium]